MTFDAASVAKKVFLYFVIPLGVALVLMAMFFSDTRILQDIVIPRMHGLKRNSWREFGLLENLQNVMLLAMLVIVVVGALRKETRIEKTALGIVAAFTLFVFLEEIDYGLHIYDWVYDIRKKDTAKVRNFHNQGDLNHTIRIFLKLGLPLVFVCIPLVFARSRYPLIRYLTPDRYSALTVLAFFIVQSVASELESGRTGKRSALGNNLSEFGELIIYYVFMLYLVEVCLIRTWNRRTDPE